MQSEMTLARAAAVQLIFRSTYNLCFEIIRRPGGDNYFCEDSDAHDVNRNFLEYIKRYHGLFMGATTKSYGVREEIRGSGAAIKLVMLNAPKKVCVSTMRNQNNQIIMKLVCEQDAGIPSA